MMVNNFTNINKMNNHLSSFEPKKIMRYGVGNPGPGLEQAQNCSWVKLVHGIPTLPL
jgi:hypothetical protein